MKLQELITVRQSDQCCLRKLGPVRHLKIVTNPEQSPLRQSYLYSPQEVHLHHHLLLLQQEPLFALLVYLSVELVQATCEHLSLALQLLQLTVLHVHQT